MGLAASQARLISLQARMSDLEYEGQQINQQRQTLTNKMNEVYSAAMDMEVPTAPSKIDYQIDAYTAKLCGKDVSLKMNSQGNWVGSMKTSAYSTEPSHTAFKFEGPIGGLGKASGDSSDEFKISSKGQGNFINRDVNGKFTSYNDQEIAGKYVREDATGSVRALTKEDIDTTSGAVKSGLKLVERQNNPKVGGQNLVTIAEMKNEHPSDTNLTNALNGLQNYIKERSDADPDNFTPYNESNFRVFVDSEGAYRFVAINGVKNDLKLENNTDGVTCLTQTYTDDATVAIDVKEWQLDDNGNIKSFTIEYPDKDGKVQKDTIKVEHSTTAYDEGKYEEAMRQYEHDKIEYDRAQNDFNHQTSIYQRQDKQLELKLTRLDNERNALNTEIDSVKKVIQDASEKGFKTFSG